MWIPKIIADDYDPRVLPLAQKTAVTIGMGMTEKQGGSDVRANTTRAYLQPDGSYEIVGHKWFFSAPMCDAWLVLAYTDRRPQLLPDARSCARTARATQSASSASRTSSATGAMRRAKSNSTAPGPSASAAKGAASRRFSRWSR